jgi:hypothetical protein
VLDARIAGLLARDEIRRVRRDKAYDLRPLVEALERIEVSGRDGLWMRLAAREGATGRPEEVVEALELESAQARYHRQRLIFG